VSLITAFCYAIQLSNIQEVKSRLRKLRTFEAASGAKRISSAQGFRRTGPIRSEGLRSLSLPSNSCSRRTLGGPDVRVAAKAQEILLIRLIVFIGHSVRFACRASGSPRAINRPPSALGFKVRWLRDQPLSSRPAVTRITTCGVQLR